MDDLANTKWVILTKSQKTYSGSWQNISLCSSRILIISHLTVIELLSGQIFVKELISSFQGWGSDYIMFSNSLGWLLGFHRGSAVGVCLGAFSCLVSWDQTRLLVMDQNFFFFFTSSSLWWCWDWSHPFPYQNFPTNVLVLFNPLRPQQTIL